MDDEAGTRNDWDSALEALKDRQQWRKHQEERLRSAGFADDIIQKLSQADVRRTRASEGVSEEDVRWNKKGETREWDLGKDDGDISD